MKCWRRPLRRPSGDPVPLCIRVVCVTPQSHSHVQSCNYLMIGDYH